MKIDRVFKGLCSELKYNVGKANKAINALSKKSLHVSINDDRGT